MERSFIEVLESFDRSLEALRRFTEIEARIEQLHGRAMRLTWGNRKQAIERVEIEISDLLVELRSIK